VCWVGGEGGCLWGGFGGGGGCRDRSLFSCGSISARLLAQAEEKSSGEKAARSHTESYRGTDWHRLILGGSKVKEVEKAGKKGKEGGSTRRSSRKEKNRVRKKGPVEGGPR